MFNRQITSYHDKQVIDENNLNRFEDEYSAKYLKSCFNPEFDLKMRVREQERPECITSSGGIGGRLRKFNTKEAIL